MQAERESLDRKIAASRAKEARLQAVLDYLPHPGRSRAHSGSRAVELMRDYDTLQETYNGAPGEEPGVEHGRGRWSGGRLASSSRSSTRLGLPERPISPNRPRLNLMGALGGLALGLALIAFFEYRDTSVRTDDDVTVEPGAAGARGHSR